MKLSRYWLWGSMTLGLVLAACGGGGGDGDGGQPPPAGNTLNAQEDLAYRSFAVRSMIVPYVIDDDTAEAFIFYPLTGKRDFVGLYPDGVTAPGNVPSRPTLDVSSCKDGGSLSSNNQLPSNIITYSNCVNGSSRVNGTLRRDYVGTTTFYPPPNANALVRSQLSVIPTLDYSFSPNIAGTIRGVQDANITEPQRVYAFRNYTLAVRESSWVSNLVLTSNRSTRFGYNTPFTLVSATGSISIDGTVYVVSSSGNIPWIKLPTTYVPTSGSFTATGPGGERIVTEFNSTGASCKLFPAGASVASITLANCSRL